MSTAYTVLKPFCVLAFVSVSIVYLTTSPNFDTGAKINRYSAGCSAGNAVIGCR